jgi:predicted dienelactone hydrolase
MNAVGWLLVGVAAVAASWWIAARNARPRELEVVSFAAAILATASLVLGPFRWQLIPWVVVSLGIATAASIRVWRPHRSHRWSRVLGRLGLIIGILVGALAILTPPVPSLAVPNGPHRVGSEIFRWTDTERPETFTNDPADHRQVIAQAWYPADANAGAPVPYFEAQRDLPAMIGGLPSWFFGGYGDIDTHAMTSVGVSEDRPRWPLILFSPGLGLPREFYTSLCVDLASRGLVVVSMSAPYESGVSVLSDGTVVGQTVTPAVVGPTHVEELAAVVDIRAADSIFVLDQLERLAEVEPDSPLVGRLDVDHVAIAGHSLGGATAAEALARDDRFMAAVDLDGKLFGAQASARLDAPFLWVQSDVTHQQEYLDSRDELLGGLRAGGLLVTVADTQHMSFTDSPAFLTSIGRKLLGAPSGAGGISVDEMTAQLSDLIVSFVGRHLEAPAVPTVAQVLVDRPSISVERRIAS